ncbi:uncharacterized protein HRG_02147 [Hirsutella rhossiliensis]|uniref:Uncharacterized protein n=1 Tax=Hirsutella rhossiliensis TaxID=111463 RepID=A0A9P8SKT3_9HYPO|nr:uncharacterized protein HRG_02147 [Hirsutella rhossiliensis]KAH0966738.1 hypothetical protein HRG_02147 [Hirsutella rhossiliensis]
MAPFLSTRASFLRDPSGPATAFRSQWTTPGDVFSVLLLLGGDVVGRALAQLTGSGLAPVAFSFGWVAYSISALVSAVGENKLMPLDPDCRCKIIDVKNAYARENSSWVLGRITRDFGLWRHPDVQEKLDQVLDKRWEQLKQKDPAANRPPIAGLIVSVYEPSRDIEAGTVCRDFVYRIGLLVIALQLGIAAIPCGLFGDWGILLWKREKWACRRQARHSYVLTRGNGSQHAIVVMGNGHGFNLEDLATGQGNIMVATNTSTRLALLCLAALWIMLLLTAAGLKQNTWFLVAVGGIGILQNIYVAGAPRRPETFGLILDFKKVFGKPSVMETLLEVESEYENVGLALRHEFFPGSLGKEDEVRWGNCLRGSKKEAGG